MPYTTQLSQGCRAQPGSQWCTPSAAQPRTTTMGTSRANWLISTQAAVGWLCRRPGRVIENTHQARPRGKNSWIQPQTQPLAEKTIGSP
jgi:hypothetical protein